MKRLVVCGLFVTAFVPLLAQQPTFRSGVDLVTVDATVLGRDGVPIDNLGPDDFRLEVDGRARRVVSAQFVSQAPRKYRSGTPRGERISRRTNPLMPAG